MKQFTNAVFFYHSGTGNALTAARWLADEISKNGITTVIHSIDHDYKADTSLISEHTLIGFIYPTHGFNLSPAMFKFIRNFPKTNKCDFILINTRAGGKFFKYFTPGLSGTALWLPLLLLIFKGYKFAGMRPLDMPSNWISLHPGLPDSWIRDISNRCEKITRYFLNDVIKGRKPYIRAVIDIPFDILILPITFGYFFVGRFFLAKTFIYSSNCDECGICAANCPVGAIKIIDNKPYWTHKCESCMRCLNICPKKSVQSSHLLVLIGILLASIPFSILINTNILHNYIFVNDFLSFIVDWLLSMFCFYTTYILILKLFRYKIINKIFQYTSLTNYWKRYKAPGIKLKDFIIK